MVESVYPMIQVEQAQEIVLAQAEALARARKPLAGALGLVLAEAVRARGRCRPLPCLSRTGMRWSRWTGLASIR